MIRTVTKILVGDKNWSGRTRIGCHNWPPAKNGPYARAAFTSIVEAQQQTQGVASKRKQQASDVLNETYTREQERRKNRLQHSDLLWRGTGDLYSNCSTLEERWRETYWTNIWAWKFQSWHKNYTLHTIAIRQLVCYPVTVSYTCWKHV